MQIQYDHSNNLHTLDGALAALARLFGGSLPRSILDVGCGTGTWLRAAQQLGVPEVFGIDGIAVSGDRSLIAKNSFLQVDLQQGWNLGRRFDLVICLEVAEHLPASSAPDLVRALTKHGDKILFSAACPGQDGDHHVNCQWPAYWQELFNREGFSCDDTPRREIWDEPKIEPWYRQNLFCATRDPERAGQEPRIASIINPAMFGGAMPGMMSVRREIIRQASEGSETLGWSLVLPFRAIAHKLRRKLGRGSDR